MVGQASFDLVPTCPTAAGSRKIYFAGNTASSGNELVILDTTTTPHKSWVVDIFVGPNNSTPDNYGRQRLPLRGHGRQRLVQGQRLDLYRLPAVPRTQRRDGAGHRPPQRHDVARRSPTR
ncbi:MAG: hypothetical protein R3F30_14505 [Planctomycetota bacterium]